MDHCELVDELGAYRELLQSGKLTEIDLDALGACLSETLTLLGDLRADSDDARILKENVKREITNMSLAAAALKDGRRNVDQSKLVAELSNLNAKQLLQVRSRAKELLSDLQRSGRMPLKTFNKKQDNQTIENYRIGVERVV